MHPRARGQALVETLVAAIALVPLAVLVVLLGKYQSIQSATVAASRSLAFDCAVRPQACTGPDAAGWLAESLRIRHFAQPDRAVVSGERAATGAASALDRHPLWHDRAGRPLIERLDHVGAQVSPQRLDAGLATAIGRAGSADLAGIGVAPASAPGLPAGFGPAAAARSPAPPGAAQVLDRLAGPTRFGLATQEGLLDARVEAGVARSFGHGAGFARLDPLALTMRARTAILTDTWQASGPRGGAASVEARTRAGARLDALREARLSAGYQLTRRALDLFGAVGLEPAAHSFRYHEVDPDVVPADRIGQP